MRKDKEEALRLRKLGKSYQDIKILLGIPKSTLSGWLSGQDWSDDISKNLAKSAEEGNKNRIQELNKIRGNSLKEMYLQAEKEAIEDCNKLKYHPLFIAGVMLYWSEGDKVNKNAFRLTNSDPVLVKIFIDFVVNICQVPREKIHPSLLLYPDIKEEDCMQVWQKEGGLEGLRFFKSTRLLTRSGVLRKTKHGICIVHIASSYLKRKMLIWIRHLPELMLKPEYYYRK